MANIRVDLEATIVNGQPLTFRSPTSCSQVTGLTIYYPEGDATSYKTFQFADAHGNNVGSANLFAQNVLVKVLLDTELNRAYVQNADTNAYLEAKFAEKAPMSHNHDASNITSGTLPIARGGTGSTSASAALAALGAAAASHNHAAGDITSGNLSSDRLPTVPITKGGTGATTASGALNNLGAAASGHKHGAGDITSGTLSSDRLPTVPITKGGTGATTAAAALTALGASPSRFASAYSSSASLSLAANSMTKLTLDRWRTNSNNAFSFSGGGIKMPVAGSVLICGSVYHQGPERNTFRYVGTYIRKNDTEVAGALVSTDIDSAIFTAPIVISVAAGDVLTLLARDVSGGSCHPANTTTALTVVYL